MNGLNLKTETAAVRSADRLDGMPALPGAAATAADTRQGERGSAPRRRFGATRMLQPFDDGLRLFRVY